VGGSFREFLGPETSVSILGLMDGEVGRPDSIMDLSLSEVPFLEVISFVFLVSWMKLSKEFHLVSEFALVETLVDEEIVLLVHRSVTSLARALEYFETSSEPIIIS